VEYSDDEEDNGYWPTIKSARCKRTTQPETKHCFVSPEMGSIDTNHRCNKLDNMDKVKHFWVFRTSFGDVFRRESGGDIQNSRLWLNSYTWRITIRGNYGIQPSGDNIRRHLLVVLLGCAWVGHKVCPTLVENFP